MRLVSPSTVGGTVDWGFAASVGTKLVRPGPATTDYTRQQATDGALPVATLP